MEAWVKELRDKEKAEKARKVREAEASAREALAKKQRRDAHQFEFSDLTYPLHMGNVVTVTDEDGRRCRYIQVYRNVNQPRGDRAPMSAYKVDTPEQFAGIRERYKWHINRTVLRGIILPALDDKIVVFPDVLANEARAAEQARSDAAANERLAKILERDRREAEAEREREDAELAKRGAIRAYGDAGYEFVQEQKAKRQDAAARQYVNSLPPSHRGV